MILKPSLCILLTLVISVTAHAQKLPNIQENSLRAPLNIKVDGNPVEWGNKFQAYNNATDIFYTMANNNENLYLVIRANDPTIISRIMGRGITLSIQKGNLKNDKKKVSITYPVTKTTLYFGLQRKIYIDADTSDKALDSLMKRHNKMIDDSCKLIRVDGIPGVDTLISVYNQDGIKVRAQFNNKKVFTCEFSVKLNLLNILTDKAEKFTYHIIVNGSKPIYMAIGKMVNGSFVPDEKGSAEMSDFAAKRSVPTDFWGEYTLAKKP